MSKKMKVGRRKLRWVEDGENNLREIKMRGWRQKANSKDWVSIVKRSKVLRGEQSQAVSMFFVEMKLLVIPFSEFLLSQVHCLPSRSLISSIGESLVLPPQNQEHLSIPKEGCNVPTQKL